MLKIESLDSLRFHVERQLPQQSRIPDLMWEQWNATADDYVCYCSILRQGFRSDFERNLARIMVCIWQWDVLYERIAVRIRKSARYVPDFIVIRPTFCIIEAKGEWRSGAKSKCRWMAEQLQERFIIVTTKIWKEAAKLNAQIERKGC